MAIDADIQKKSWADDVDELGGSLVGAGDAIRAKSTDQASKVDEDGVRVVVEYAVDDQGKKIKITRTIRRTLKKAVVEHVVAERKKWAKFGQERGKKPGPDQATTTVGESVSLKISAGNKASEPELSTEQTTKTESAKTGLGKVMCRLCTGDHFTAKCPYKDQLAGLDNPDSQDDGATATDRTPASTSGKYVPPSMRPRGPGEPPLRASGAGGPGTSREDLPTLRVTNLSEETREEDLRELFGGFGRVARVYVGRDKETGIGKGFAFVSFEDRQNAQRAMDKLHGKGYDNLILNVQWSQPRPDGR